MADIRQAGQRRRRTAAEMATAREQIRAIVAATHPMGVRQVFYQMVMRHGLEKSEMNCDEHVGRLLTEMRWNGTIAFEWIDDGRHAIESNMYDSPSEVLEETARIYHRRRWATQPEYVQIWVEKEGLTGTLAPVTQSLFVPLWTSGGSASLSSKVKCARTFLRYGGGRRCHLYMLFDHDPAGKNMPAVLERDIRRVIEIDGGGLDLSVHLLALHAEQVRDWELPSRPTKKNPRDYNARDFVGRSTELDAIPPARLQELVESAIREHVDPVAWQTEERKEQDERQQLIRLAATWPPKRTSR